MIEKTCWNLDIFQIFIYSVAALRVCASLTKGFDVGSQVVTFVHWAEQQWILNLLLFPQLLWQDKICINFCCTSCTYKNLSNSMPSSSRVPVSWCSIAIGIAPNPLFFFFQVLRSKDQRLCNEKPTKLEMTFTSFRNIRVYICGYHNHDDFHGLHVSSFQIL